MLEMKNSYADKVAKLISWGHWFTLGNIILTMLIALRYIVYSPFPDTLLGQFYLIVSWLGHFSFLTFIFYLLILFPLTFLLPNKKTFLSVSALIATIGQVLLIIDTNIYYSINLHLTSVIWEFLFKDNDSSVIQTDMLSLVIVIPLVLIAQFSLAHLLWRKLDKFRSRYIGKTIIAIFTLSFITTHLMYVWADAFFYNPIIDQRANFPLSYPMTARGFMEKYGLIQVNANSATNSIRNNLDTKDIYYPLEPLKFEKRANKLNILMVNINNLRADALNTNDMPATYQFAINNQYFTKHYSSSNDVYGSFGLFYGIPSNYINSIVKEKIAPVFVSSLQDNDYALQFFSANSFVVNLVQNVDLAVNKDVMLADNLPLAAASSDQQMIQDWQNWLIDKNKSNKSPWFSYIELAANNSLDIRPVLTDADDITTHLKRMYLQNVNKVDNSVEQILQTLTDQNLLDSTVVIITSDHSSNFSDLKNSKWGANSNYSNENLMVPMIIHWPGILAAKFIHNTSHLDVSVTLMQNILGVSSNPNEYSSGRNLFDESNRSWVLAGNTSEIALITVDQITVIDQLGNYKLFDHNYKPLHEMQPQLPIIMKGLTEIQRFYNKL